VRAPHGSGSPLVTTVTKIIGVVPPLIRVLIGALVALALALGASSRLAAVRARRLARQRRELLEDVGLLQAALLPPLPGRLGPVGTSAAYHPASGPGAGGDFYDVFALGDGQLAVIVGDVSGHGRRALPHTTLVRFTLRAYLEAGMSPRAALQAAAPVLERQLGDSFATVVLATYNPRERILVYSCAGHPPPLIIGTESVTPITVCSAPPIGVGRLTGTRQTAVSIPGGALACFYTDGVIEARTHGELFGVGRLERVVSRLGEDPTASSLLDRVAEQSDDRPDDMAACLLSVEGQPAAPAVQLEELEIDGREAGRDRAERFLLAGGVEPNETQAIVSSIRSAVARHGRIVVELHLSDEAPEVVLRPQNVALLQPPVRDQAVVGGLSG
jgi:serine phosphatase RsbU (regulator of sigma subunit)